MTRKWTGRVGEAYVFCKTGKLGLASLLAQDWDFDIGGIHTFDSIPLQQIDEPNNITHYGAITPVDALMDLDIKASGPTVTKFFSADGYTWESAKQAMFLEEPVYEEII